MTEVIRRSSRLKFRRAVLASFLVAAAGLLTLAAPTAAFAAPAPDCTTVASNLIQNCSFETNNVGPGNYRYVGADPLGRAIHSNGTATSYSFTGGAGVAATGSAFTPPEASNGSYFAFLQNTSSVAQTVSNLTGGTTYSLTFDAVQRTQYNTTGQTIQIKLDGTVIKTITPPGITYQDYTVSLTPSTSGTHTISFVGTSTGRDNTAFIDNISLTESSTGPVDCTANPTAPGCTSATPELGSGELLATGLLPIGAVLLYRRRRTRRAAQQQ